MAGWQCYEPGCRGMVAAIVPEGTDRCMGCGSANGELLSNERIDEGMKAVFGMLAYFTRGKRELIEIVE